MQPADLRGHQFKSAEKAVSLPPLALPAFGTGGGRPNARASGLKDTVHWLIPGQSVRDATFNLMRRDTPCTP